uniref:Reverse transcriptase Ty1/copia-type domain-containing protein n=2 Tax=Vitis vinifera TaxID=29760 RepID=A5BZB2_VITVI|nr:hypothetical protein VITISV_029627 [Vitis vinifera]
MGCYKLQISLRGLALLVFKKRGKKKLLEVFAFDQNFGRLKPIFEVSFGPKVSKARNKARGGGLDLLRKETGILHDSSRVNTSQQNGVAKRKNGHLLNTTQVLLFQGNVPKSYWGEAVLTATYMINRILSRVLDNKSPVEILKSFYPHFRTSNGLTPRALTKRELKDAMREEMSTLERNKTWEIVERPKGKNIVDCKWIFTLKYKVDGSLERHKARLVAKWYTQMYGVDYQETFAPVAKMNTVRILLSLATHYNWQLLQYNVKNAFLHGDLDEEIYMNIPPRFEGNKVCKLKKALYGLKQSPRAWFERFTKVMKESRYKQSQGDHTLFIKHSAAGGVTALLVYVNDIIVTRNDEREKHEVKQRLATEFEIKELGKLKYFLSIEVAYSIQGTFISQQKYVIDLLAETGKIGCKPVSTPMDPNHKLGEVKEEPVVDKRMYQRLVGRLIYLAHTRPNIVYSVSVISQFMHDPREPHLQATYRVLHYLKGNPGKGILFKKNNTVALEAYTDADYAGSLVDRRSTTGYCTFLGGNLVTWRSKKQNVVARSSTESKFRVIAQGLCELLWLKIILDDLRIKWDGPMKLYCDNKSAINIAHNPIQHDRTKHIEIDRHFIKEKLEERVVCMSYVPSEHQLVDILTKGLNSSMFHDLVLKLGMEDIYFSA